MKKQSIEEKLNTIEEQFKSIKLLLSEVKEIMSASNQEGENKVVKPQTDTTPQRSSNTKIKRISDEREDLPKDTFEQKKYEIKVVGLGVEKIKE
jgi:uncharacterized protein (DUF342 family)